SASTWSTFRCSRNRCSGSASGKRIASIAGTCRASFRACGRGRRMRRTSITADSLLPQPPLLQLVLVQAEHMPDLLLGGDAHFALQLLAVSARAQQVPPEDVDRAGRARGVRLAAAHARAADEQAEHVRRDGAVLALQHVA